MCAHFRCFKYVYKYTFKAPDYTAVVVNEIDAHLAGRLLSASEAVHRLLELPLHKEFPNVVRLDIHMPQMQTMVFDPTADENDLLQQLTSTTSKLMGWFDLNADDAFARTLYYSDVPGFYIWEDSRWRRRIQTKVCEVDSHRCAVPCAHVSLMMYLQTQPVGRIFGVSHHNCELFALRRLLSVVKGATSFIDMATYEGVAYDSFQAACRARGMMADDSDLIAAMDEIIETTVAAATIRRMFARMLVHSAPHDPQALFHMYAADLIQQNDDLDSVSAALLALEADMRDLGRSLQDDDFGFELPEARNEQPECRRRRTATGVSPAEAQQQADALLPQFTDEQSAALEQVVTTLRRGGLQSKVFALLASAGCGKTLFANGLAAFLRSQHMRVMCVAASALAAMLLTGGTTAHSALHIPIPCNEFSTCSLSRVERDELKRVDVIIYDECSMVHSDVADTVDRTLRDIMRNQHPFGGKCVVWMGDFKQLLPVVRYGKGFNFTMQRCSWWKSVTKLQFTRNWRAIANPQYTAWLEDIGRGVIDRVEIPDAQRVHSYADMIDVIYGDTIDCPQSHQILALTLETCAVINRMCFDKMPGESTECRAADSYIDCPDRDAYPPEYVESLPMHGAPPYMIQFKIGARYMCIKNIDIHRGLINGTMMRLLACGRRYAQFQILSGKCAGSVEIVTKAMFAITPEASGLPFTVLRRQYPIIPAYCLSVHKAQGQSLQKVGIIFESDPFTHGQL